MKEHLERKNLGFEDSVKKHFSFLCHKYGYECVYSDPYYVQYVSKEVYVNVFHEKESYEIYVEFGRFPEHYDNPLRIDLFDVLLMKNPCNSPLFFQASIQKDVDEAVRKLSYLTQKNADEALRGSREYYESASIIMEKMHKRSVEKHQQKFEDEKVESAWRRRDYSMVIKLLGMKKGPLKEIERRRLEYAQKEQSKKLKNESGERI